MQRHIVNAGRFVAPALAAMLLCLPVSAQTTYQPADPYAQPPADTPYSAQGYPNAGQAQPYPPPQGAGYSNDEILDAGHQFFGRISTDLASAVEYVFSRYGQPTGYIVGEEGSGAFFAGARYGEGDLHMKAGGVRRVFWQGPSVGLDLGAEGARIMVLTYNLPSAEAIYDTFGSTAGVAYMVGGLGVTFQSNERDVVLAVIHSGVGVRLGINLGYVKYTPQPTWNPF